MFLVVWRETSTASSATLPCNGEISLAISCTSTGVESENKLNSSNLLRSVIQTPQFARKYFANLHLMHGEKTKVVKAQIDSASTCNTIPNSLMRELFPNADISARSKINTYGSETTCMRPEGQVTLCCERRCRIHTIDFLVVNDPDVKPALLSGRDAQDLNYLKVYAYKTANAVEEEPDPAKVDAITKMPQLVRNSSSAERLDKREFHIPVVKKP